MAESSSTVRWYRPSLKTTCGTAGGSGFDKPCEMHTVDDDDDDDFGNSDAAR